MSFIHPPTLFSLAIGGGLTLWDLLQYQRHALSEVLEDFGTLHLPSGSVLEHLEASGVVEVSRDSYGQILRVTLRTSLSALVSSVSELVHQNFTVRVDKPLSNQRLKLAARVD